MKLNRLALLALALSATAYTLTSCGSGTTTTSPVVDLDTTPPAAPSNVHGTFDAQGNRDYLNWDLSASPDVASYEVWVYNTDPGTGGTGVKLATVDASIDYQPLPVSGVSTTQFFRVRAVDTSGNESAYSATAGVDRHVWDGGNGGSPGNTGDGGRGIIE